MKIVLTALLLSSFVAAPALANPDFVHNPPPAPSALSASNGTAMISPLDDITFELDSSSLSSAALDQLNTAAKWLKKHPKQRLVIEGYADHSGARAYNAELSMKRAYAVRQHMVGWGIGRDRIVMAVYGERGATGDTDTLDRKVVIYASDRPVKEIVMGSLYSRKAMNVVWMNGNTLVTERRNGTTVQIATR